MLAQRRPTSTSVWCRARISRYDTVQNALNMPVGLRILYFGKSLHDGIHAQAQQCSRYAVRNCDGKILPGVLDLVRLSQPAARAFSVFQHATMSQSDTVLMTSPPRNWSFEHSTPYRHDLRVFCTIPHGGGLSAGCTRFYANLHVFRTIRTYWRYTRHLLTHVFR